MGRIMALDYGSKTVGVALSDELHITANGLEIVRRPNEIDVKETLVRLLAIIKEYNVEKIVLGLPKNMDNSLGASAENVMRFKEKLAKLTDKEIILWDERLTTVQTHNMMRDAGVNWKKRMKVVDKVAATLILQNYLDASGLKMPW